MEYETIIFTAARHGKLYRLKVFLDHKSEEEVTRLVSARTNGSTPLIEACRYGHLFVATYLIVKCRADIEQTGTVTCDDYQTVEKASPLWCAAAAGHLNVVKFLMKHKASVNTITKYNSTPLRAACFDGYIEIVKYLKEHGADIEIADRHGYTCLMLACHKGFYEISKYLVECGADVNRRTSTGKTALHDCAESGSLDLVKLILDNGAIFLPDSSGRTPIISAALLGRAAIVEYFLQGFTCYRREKIDALELLGSIYVEKNRDIILALNCWRRAMELRYEARYCPIEKPEMRSPIECYVNVAEVRTLSQLEELMADPTEVKMQALLVRERILGEGLPDNLFYIRKTGAAYASNGDFVRCIQLWMYALDTEQKGQNPLSLTIQSSLSAFTKLFSYAMTEDQQFAIERPFVTFRDIFCVYERALKAIERASEAAQERNENLNNCSMFHQLLVTAIHLVSLMCQLQPHMTKSEELELKKAVCRLVSFNPRGKSGCTPLHLAVNTFPSPEVIDLLLEVGVSPNALDLSRNTPLHLAAKNKPFVPAIFNSLLNRGAHLDQCNDEKQTPLQLVQDMPSLVIHPLQYLNLQCLSAKAVQYHKIPYKGLVHKKLEVFLDSH